MKLMHSLRFQFIVLFSVFVIALSTITSALEIQRISEEVVETFAMQGIRLVEEAASIIDGDSFEALSKSLDKNDPFYEKIGTQLLQLKKMTGCLYLYSMAPVNGIVATPAKGEKWRFVIVAREKPDDEDIGDEADAYDIILSDDGFRKVLVSGKTERSGLYHMDEWGYMISFHTPVRNSAGKVVGIISSDFNGTKLHDTIVAERKRQIIIGGVSLLLGIVLLLFFLRKIFTPLGNINAILKDISEGEGDLTQSIKAEAKNEIGELARHFNKLMATLRSPISEAKTTVSSLVSVSEKLSSVSTQLASGAEKSVALSNTAADTIEQMATNITAMASGAEQASHNANDVASTAEQMSTNMNTIASAIEEMSASISEIADNTNEVRKVASEATGKATDATDAMKKLGVAAKEIGQVTDVIKKIADKTNLLALNATIEAASAGEAGKGFAVVAGEIKELANQSAKSADDIAHRIESIQAGTGNAVKVINDVNDIIVKINLSVETIAGHAEQETKASIEIANNVAQANTGAKRVSDAISVVAKGANDVSRNSSEAAKGAIDVSHNAVGMSMAANESSHSASQVSQSATELSQMAGQLRTAMDKFRV